MDMLILNFRDAKSFKYPDGAKYWKSGDLPETQKKLDIPVETLNYRVVNNLLHVLCGERPYSSRWYTPIDGEQMFVPEIVEAAKNSHVHIDTVYISKKGTKSYYQNEFMQTKKPDRCSWMKTSYSIKVGRHDREVSGTLLTWEVMLCHLGYDLFDALRVLCDNICGSSCLDIPILEFLEKYGEHPDLVKFATDHEKDDASLMLLITGHTSNISKIEGKEGEFVTGMARFGVNDPNRYKNPQNHHRINPRGIATIQILRGKIYVPVTKKILEKIANGPGWATLLDGGIVTIEQKCQSTPLLLAGTVPVDLGEMKPIVLKEKDNVQNSHDE